MASSICWNKKSKQQKQKANLSRFAFFVFHGNGGRSFQKIAWIIPSSKPRRKAPNIRRKECQTLLEDGKILLKKNYWQLSPLVKDFGHVQTNRQIQDREKRQAPRPSWHGIKKYPWHVDQPWVCSRYSKIGGNLLKTKLPLQLTTNNLT